MSIRITVTDLENPDDTETQEITDDVVVICAGRHFVSTVDRHANGTQVWTIKVDKAGHHLVHSEAFVDQDDPRASADCEEGS